MIDVHCHILPGLDDGARNLYEARGIARASAAEGITTIVATPHVREDYPTSAAAMEEALAALRADFEREAIPVEVLPGGEVSLSALWEIAPADLVRFSLAGSGLYILLEFPSTGWPLALEAAISTVLGRDLRPVFSHPERNSEVQAHPDRLAELVDRGALMQVTAASLDGRLGQHTKATAERLVELGLVHVLASDAHGPHIREAGLLAAADALQDEELAAYLTQGVPAAIVAGASLPAWPTMEPAEEQVAVPVAHESSSLESEDSGSETESVEEGVAPEPLVAGNEHLLFVPTDAGYVIFERAGPPPVVGSAVQLSGHDGEVFTAAKIGRSPYPGDQRPCVYLLAG